MQGKRASLLVGGLLAPLVASSLPWAPAFTSPLFHSADAALKTVGSKQEEVQIDFPNFDELFDRIQKVSPLASMAFSRKEGGFQGMDMKEHFKWNVVDANKKKTVHRIDKIDNFQNLGVPIFRFRSSLKGPCLSECFANFIMDLEQRQKWDPQIAAVHTVFPIDDLRKTNEAIGPDHGICSRLGVGYCATKPNLVADSREQLTMCGIQDFEDGSSVIWGAELEDKQNHLFPPGKRHTRARSHLFSTTLMPTGPDSFDVEYVLQMDIGGKIPTFLTGPVLVETVKLLFNYASEYFRGGEDSDIAKFIADFVERNGLFSERKSLLLTP